jgi:hypothetical protein
MEAERAVIDKEVELTNIGTHVEKQPRTSKAESQPYADRDLSLRPVPAVDIAIRDVNVTLRNSITLKSKLKRKKASDVAEGDKRILDGVSADFPTGSLTGTTSHNLGASHAMEW